jgi:hypothetical protein
LKDLLNHLVQRNHLDRQGILVLPDHLAHPEGQVDQCFLQEREDHFQDHYYLQILPNVKVVHLELEMKPHSVMAEDLLGIGLMEEDHMNVEELH